MEFDAVPQVLEHGKGFAFIFLLRIFLGIAAQVYALSQVVHGGKMFAPLVVDGLQHHVALEISHCLLADQFGFGGIFVFDTFDQALMS